MNHHFGREPVVWRCTGCMRDEWNFYYFHCILLNSTKSQNKPQQLEVPFVRWVYWRDNKDLYRYFLWMTVNFLQDSSASINIPLEWLQPQQALPKATNAQQLRRAIIYVSNKRNHQTQNYTPKTHIRIK